MIPQNAIALAKTFEGFYSMVYLCPGGYPTIGWGHRCSKEHPPITKAHGEFYLEDDLMDSLKGTIRTCPILLTVHELWLGAIVDFVFNLGVGQLQVSTLRRRINEQDWTGVVYELNRWVYGGGKKLRGLVLRRAAEAAFILNAANHNRQ